MPEPGRRGRARTGRRARLRIGSVLDGIGEWTSWLSLAIVALMATNVLLRYLFSTGSVWAQELEWHLLVPLILFGMSYALRHGAHVRVDVVYGRFSPRTKLYVDFVSALLTVAISVIVIWLSVKYVAQSFVIDEGSPDPGGIPHRYIVKGLIPVGFGLLLLQGVAAVLECIEKLWGRRS